VIQVYLIYFKQNFNWYWVFENILHEDSENKCIGHCIRWQYQRKMGASSTFLCKIKDNAGSKFSFCLWHYSAYEYTAL